MRVFIAGPYGDRNPKAVIAQNVAIANHVARDLMASGHQVFCPHTMSWGWEDDTRLNEDQFKALDMTFLRLWAEAIIRIPGRSGGADAEMNEARRLGLVELPFPPAAPPDIVGVPG